MSRPLDPQVRERATMIAELLLESTAERDRTAVAIEVARVVDAPDLDAALATLDRGIAAAPTDDTVIADLRSLRARVLESARIVSLPAPAAPTATRTLAALPVAASGDLPTYAAFGVTDRAVPLLAAWVLARPTRARRADLDAVGTTLRPIARELVDEIGSLGLLRAPLPSAAWGEGAAFEDRLVAAIDALGSLAMPTTTGPGLDVAALALEHALDWPVPEPARVFAVALLFSLSSSYAALAALAALARVADERTTDALIAAVALGSHPDLDRLVSSRILDETRADALALWLDVARRRRVVPRAALDLLAHPDPRVAIAAARAAVFLDPAVAAPELVGRLEDESRLSVEVATTLAVFGAQAGPQHLRQLLARLVRTEATPSELAVAAGSSLAIVGDGRDAPLLAEWVQGEPGLLAVLAWHGHPSFVAPLLARMDAIDSGTRTNATSALARIVLPADRLAHADEAEVRAAAARLAGSAAPRLRSGEAYRLEHSIDELARPDSVASARRTSWLEASIAARRPIPLDVDDWIGRQRRTLDGLLSKARASKEPAR